MNPTPTPQPIDEPDQHPVSSGKVTPKLDKYFKAMIKADASDLHIKPDMVPHIRVKARIKPTSVGVLSAQDVEDMAMELLSDKQKAYFEANGSIDVAHELKDSDRYRINIFRQRGQVAIAVRRVVREIPDFTTLNLPPVVETIANGHQGLVLLSGPTGCGKSTTIASMINHVNATRACHIITIEDPIEFLFTSNKAIISQREIGLDVADFESALKYLMREDPDLVLVGEMRDQETLIAALRAAETGHLIFGTIHASTASQTISRILDLVGPDSRELVRQALATNLSAVICQRLMPSVSKDFDRVPAIEVLINNPTVGKLIEEQRDAELGDIINASEAAGMQSFNKSLFELIEKDFISPQVAYEVAPNPDELKMRLKGISTSTSGLISRG